jgi:hypothetical protein
VRRHSGASHQAARRTPAPTPAQFGSATLPSAASVQ